jgi:hypothetical protein
VVKKIEVKVCKEVSYLSDLRANGREAAVAKFTAAAMLRDKVEAAEDEESDGYESEEVVNIIPSEVVEKTG